MKKNKMIAILLFAITVFSFSACEKESVVDESRLPSKAQEYISTHFKGIPVIQVVKDLDGLSKSYEVYLENGVELEFKRNGDIKSVKNNKNERLPDSAIPSKILTYIEANYAEFFVISWELDDAYQEVELSNRMELVFSKSGDFIRID